MSVSDVAATAVGIFRHRMLMTIGALEAVGVLSEEPKTNPHSHHQKRVHTDKVQKSHHQKRVHTDKVQKSHKKKAHGDNVQMNRKKRVNGDYMLKYYKTLNYQDKFSRFYKDIRLDTDNFFTYYRMSIKSFDELLTILRSSIQKDSHRKISICPEERLTLTLRYLSTGHTISSLQSEFEIGRSTMGGIVRETCSAIWTCLKDLEMLEPTQDEWYNIADEFYAKTNFPNCIGAVDGKYVRCAVPQFRGSKVIKAKNCSSVVLIAVVDSNLRFVAIDVSDDQKADSTFFRNSPLGKKLYSNQLNIPPPRCLPNTYHEPQPFVFLGDEAFKLHTNLLRPYSHRALDDRKQVYNDRLSQCRSVAESAFGVLASKWRIFHTPIIVNQDFAVDIIKACCILHNFVRKRDGINIEDEHAAHPFPDVTNVGYGPIQGGMGIREFFADYFMNEGAITVPV